MSKISTPVWDLPTRVFHWLLAASVLVGYITGGERGTAFAVHVFVGHLIVLLILFRILWGFFGSPRSRFADFTYSWSKIRAYVRQMLRFRPGHYTGHNPLGGLMVLTMILVLVLLVVTGFAGAAARGYQAGSPLIAMMGAGSRAAGQLHELLGSLIMILAGIHVAAVFGHWLFTRDNLVRAMITGRKQLTATEAARERPLAGPVRVGAFALLVLLGAFGVMRGFDAQVLMSRPTIQSSEASTGTASGLFGQASEGHSGEATD